MPKNQDPRYPYAGKMLEEIKNEYVIENERENKIATKASAFITVVVAIITLYCELPEQLTRFGRELVIQILYQSGFFNTFCGIAVEKSGAMWYYLAG